MTAVSLGQTREHNAWLDPDPPNMAAQYANLDDRYQPSYKHRRAARYQPMCSPEAFHLCTCKVRVPMLTIDICDDQAGHVRASFITGIILELVARHPTLERTRPVAPSLRRRTTSRSTWRRLKPSRSAARQVISRAPTTTLQLCPEADI